MSILDPRLWLAALAALVLAFAGGYLKGSSAGKKEIRNEQAAAIAKANVDAFKASERMQRNVDEASSLAAAAAVDDRARAAGADRAIGRLRSTLDAADRASQDSLAAARRTAAAYRTVYESCVAEYRDLGQAASGHARDSLKLQMSWPKGSK
jgi:hypothetical protein